MFKTIIEPNLNDYIGHIFEDICKDYMLLHINTDKILFVFNQIGRWWGTNSITKTEEEIDIIEKAQNNIELFSYLWYNNKKEAEEI